jgi:hypothetical protein
LLGQPPIFFIIEGERQTDAVKEGKKNLLPLPLCVREEEDAQCRSKQYRFGLFFNEQCMKRCYLILKKMTPKCVNFQMSLQFFICSIKSSIAILILRRSSIAFLPKSDVSPKVGRLFHFGIWSRIYAI